MPAKVSDDAIAMAFRMGLDGMAQISQRGARLDGLAGAAGTPRPG